MLVVLKSALDKSVSRKTRTLLAAVSSKQGLSTSRLNDVRYNQTSSSTVLGHQDKNVNDATKSPVTFPLSTKVVICGGGLFGTSVAYHLAQLGYTDVVLVTRDTLGSGSSRFSTGLVELIKMSPTETIFSKYSASLYKKLQDEGHDLSNT